MKTYFIAALSVLLIGLGSLAFALTSTDSHDVTMQVTEIALLGLNDTTSVTLTTIQPGGAGLNPTGSSDSSKKLHYTSLVPSGQTRNITVQWGGTDAAPAGTSLSLEAVSVPANSGTATGPVIMSNTGQSLVSNIGSCATGIGVNGTALTYTFNIDTPSSLLVGDNKTVTITFTLTDAS